MTDKTTGWKERIVTPEKALAAIEPGMSIFVAPAWPNHEPWSNTS